MASTKILLDFSRAIQTEFQNTHPAIQQNEKEALNKRVGEIGAKALSLMGDYTAEKSLKAQVDVYNALSQSLKKVAQAYTKSQTVWEYIKSLFFCGTAEEKTLYEALHKAQERRISTRVEHANSWLPADRKLERLNPFGWMCYKFLGAETFRLYGWDAVDLLFERDIGSVNNSFNNYLTSEETKYTQSVAGRVKLGAYRVLGSNRMKSDQLEGMDSLFALQSVKREFHEFIQIFNLHFSVKETEFLTNVEQQLRYAISICKKMMLAKSIYAGSNPNFDYVAEDNPIRKEFLSRIADIASEISVDIGKLPVGASLVFSGGYSRLDVGHDVLLKVTREDDSSYKFTVVNTGDGATEFENVFSLIGASFKGMVNGEMKFSDYEVPGLTLEEVANPEFLREIVRVRVEPSANSGPKAMLDPIIKYLAKGDVKNLRRGPEHSIQTNGTCSRSCVQTWLESLFDKAFYKTYELSTIVIGLAELFTVQDTPSYKAEIDALKAEWGELFTSNLKGMELLNTIIRLGRENAEKAKKELLDLLKGAKERIEKSKNELKYEVVLASAEKRLKKLKEKENPEAFIAYSQRLEAKVTKLKTEYCQSAKQDPAKEINSPGLFASAELKSKWEKYSEKKDKYDKLMHVASTNHLFYQNNRDAITKVEAEIATLKSKKSRIDWETHNIVRCESIISIMFKPKN